MRRRMISIIILLAVFCFSACEHPPGYFESSNIPFDESSQPDMIDELAYECYIFDGSANLYLGGEFGSGATPYIIDQTSMLEKHLEDIESIEFWDMFGNADEEYFETKTLVIIYAYSYYSGVSYSIKSAEYLSERSVQISIFYNDDEAYEEKTQHNLIVIELEKEQVDGFGFVVTSEQKNPTVSEHIEFETVIFGGTYNSSVGGETFIVNDIYSLAEFTADCSYNNVGTDLTAFLHSVDENFFDSKSIIFILGIEMNTVPSFDISLVLENQSRLMIYFEDKTDYREPTNSFIPALIIDKNIFNAETAVTLIKNHNGEGHSELYIEGINTGDIINYFSEVCLSAEFSVDDYISAVRKWQKPISYKIHGRPTEKDVEVIENTAKTLNAINGFPGMYENENGVNINMNIHFCDSAEFDSLLGSNGMGALGVAQTWFLDNGSIVEVQICIKNDMTSQEDRNSIIVEEIYNGLGATNDTALRTDSIIYQYSDKNLEMSPIDIVILKLLYHEKMVGGADALQAEKIIRELYY